MIFLAKSRLKISILLLVSLPVFFFSSVPPAQASTLSDLTTGVSLFVKFLSQNFIGVKNSFCDDYVSSTASGAWGTGDIRVQLGQAVCAGFVPATITQVDTSTASSSTSLSFPFFSFPSLPTFSSDNAPIVPVANTNTTATSSAIVTTSNASSTTDQSADVIQNTGGDGNVLNDGEIIYWTNIQRADNGPLPGLSENSILDAIALIRVQDMFAKQYFSHYSPTGDNVSLEANANGYQYITIGENIALGNFDSARDLILAWMNSPDHRANILNTDYTEIGVASMEGMYQGQQVLIASQVFGEPLSVCPQPSATLKATITSENASAQSLSAQMSAANDNPSVYNSLVPTYNNLVTEIKTLTAQYNQQVTTFNNCIKT